MRDSTIFPVKYDEDNDYNLIPEWICISFHSLFLLLKYKYKFSRRIEFSQKHVGFNDDWFEVRFVAAGNRSSPGKDEFFMLLRYEKEDWSMAAAIIICQFPFRVILKKFCFSFAFCPPLILISVFLHRFEGSTVVRANNTQSFVNSLHSQTWKI